MSSRSSTSGCRLHILGASGSGTTTLGRAVASLWSVPHADVDDYFWLPSVPPFVDKRPEADRLRLMEALFLPRDAWVLSGSMIGWGDSLVPHLDAVVFVTLDPETRLDRLRARESARFGQDIAPGGPRDAAHRAFIDWAANYDNPAFEGRSRVGHEQWLAALACPVLRVDGAGPIDQLGSEIAAWAASVP